MCIRDSSCGGRAFWSSFTIYKAIVQSAFARCALWAVGISAAFLRNKMCIRDRAAGTTGVYTDFKLEVDDGRVLYEGEMRSGWMEYEFEIDAVTGAIIDWEADWD